MAIEEQRRSAWRRRTALLSTVGLATAILSALPSQAGATQAPPLAPERRAASASGDVPADRPHTSVTLVTGETVHVYSLADGKTGITVDPAVPGDDIGSAFMSYEDPRGDLHVVPSTVGGLIPAYLDTDLFNVSALIRDGYDDRSTDALPLIVTYDGFARALPGLETTRRLDSIDGASVRLDKDDAATFGSAIAEARGAGGDGFLPGVEKIWLDGRVEASLDESVAQIGAPSAWELGYDGTGVSVAVLDTGIDAEHPDLSTQVVAAQNFTDSASVADVIGHGTHVASIVAGTGAESDGQYTGVAYGAELLNGKVISDQGFGLDSWVIAGMEWAATEQGADVVNMSLGSRPTDGTDPVSQALNQLSADEGTLFVAAAGNFGYGQPETVSAPAAATAALAVGAVDGSEVLADFSGLGPRVGDYAVKPEITAPGVDITAAMADGAPIGPPVGDSYMTLSGTSAAAPHVAGAAALLAQQHPDWNGEQLKAALVTSAAPNPEYTVWQQGGGRVDVEAVVAQTLHADQATLSLGALLYPHDDGETSTETVTFTNPSDVPVEVALTLDVADEDGNPAAPDLVTVVPAALSIPAGGSASADVTVDPVVGAFGLYSGHLVATAGAEDELLHVPLGFYKEPEAYDLTIDVIGRDGGTDFNGFLSVLNVDDGDKYYELFFVGGPDGTTVSTRVPAGTYSAGLHTARLLSDVSIEMVSVDEPQFEVATDVAFTLDSRETVQINVDVGEPVVALPVAEIATYRSPVIGDGYSFYNSAGGFDQVLAYAKPTESVSEGEFEFYSRWGLQSADRTYDLIFPEPNQIPTSLSYDVGVDDVARVSSVFHTHVPDRTYYTARFGYRPWSGFGFGGFTATSVPSVREDWVSGGDTRWTQMVDAGEAFLSGQLQEPLTTYEAGQQYSRSWFKQLVRPGEADDGIPSVRYDDTFQLFILEFLDAANNYGFQDPGFEGPSIDEVHFVLTANGQVLVEGPYPAGLFPALPDPAEYRAELTVQRDAPWWTLSTETDTVWTFDSARPPPGEQEFIPLLQVDYGVDVDLLNTSSAPTPITFDVYHQPGAEPVDITSFGVQASVDDGESWSDVGVDDLGEGQFEGMIEVPDTCEPECFVSLRVEAGDDAGNALEQTITRAYLAVPQQPTPSPTPTDPSPSPTPTDPTPTPTPTDPPPTDPTPVPTTTLPGTGGELAVQLAAIGLAAVLAGGLFVGLAARRLRREG